MEQHYLKLNPLAKIYALFIMANLSITKEKDKGGTKRKATASSNQTVTQKESKTANTALKMTVFTVLYLKYWGMFSFRLVYPHCVTLLRG